MYNERLAYPVNVVTACDKRFFPYLPVMFLSLLENNPNCGVTLYLLHTELTQEDISVLEQIARKFQARVVPLRIDTSPVAAMPTRERLPLIVYFRLYAADILPQTAERALILDVDLIVRKPLDEFYQTDFEGSLCVACEDEEHNVKPYKDALGVPAGHTYFNAGVLLLNLRQMRRENKTLAYLLQTAGQHLRRLVWLEQDVFNLAFCNRVKCVPAARYNCTPQMFSYLHSRAEEHAFASVVHYLSPDCKPWKFPVASPGSEAQELWWRYAQKTPFYPVLREQYENGLSETLMRQNLALKQYWSAALFWLKTPDRQKRAEAYLLRRGWHRISVYGINPLQEILCMDLTGTRIRIPYLMDSYSEGYSLGFPIRTVRPKETFDGVDAVVVAACAHFEAICRALSHVDFPVISIEELIHGIYQMQEV